MQLGNSVRCRSMQLRLDEVRPGSMGLLGNIGMCERCGSWEVGKLERRCVVVFVVVGKRERW